MAERLELTGDLQQQRRLSNPGFSANKNHRAGYDAAAEHEIEFLDAGLETTPL